MSVKFTLGCFKFLLNFLLISALNVKLCSFISVQTYFQNCRNTKLIFFCQRIFVFFLVSHLQLKCKVWISGGKKTKQYQSDQVIRPEKTLHYSEYFSPPVFNLGRFVSSAVVLSHFKASFRNCGSAVFLPQNIYMQYLNINVVCVTCCSIVSSLCLCISTGGSVSQPAVTNLKAF